MLRHHLVVCAGDNDNTHAPTNTLHNTTPTDDDNSNFRALAIPAGLWIFNGEETGMVL